MTVLHFVRHGETVWHRENRYAGVSDIELTDKGARQGEQLARWAKDAPIGRVICSDLQRAITTARPSAVALGLELEIEPRIRELDFGQGEGLTAAEMRVAFPAAYEAFVAAPASSGLPGGETGASAVARSAEVLGELVGSDLPGDVLLVAHNTLGRLLLCHLLGIPLDAYRTVFPQVLNGAVTSIELVAGVRPGGARLLRFNCPVAALRPS